MNLRNQSGFSLVELMVVVAIIAILSMIAIPSYQGFQAKARQKEGLALLNTYFTAAQATRAEFGDFPGDFVRTGFAPTGVLGYRLRAVRNAGSTVNIGIIDNGCIHTAAACNCGGACPNFRTWQELAPIGAVGVRYGPRNPAGGACGVLAATGTTDNAFSVRVAGVINLKSVRADEYGINEQKVIQMCADGLN